jgi:hypothetical protein
MVLKIVQSVIINLIKASLNAYIAPEELCVMKLIY